MTKKDKIVIFVAIIALIVLIISLSHTIYQMSDYQKSKASGNDRWLQVENRIVQIEEKINTLEEKLQ